MRYFGLGAACHSKLLGRNNICFLLLCRYLLLLESSHPTILELSKDKKKLSHSKWPSACLVLLVMYGGFHTSFRTKYDFFYQISRDCPLKDGDARIKQRQNRRTHLCVRWRIPSNGVISSPF